MEKKLINKITIPAADGFIFLPIDEIIYCKAISNYTQIVLTNNQRITSSYTLKQYDELLSNKNFFRVHKSFLVNLYHIQKYRRSGMLVVSNGFEIEVSNFKKSALIKRFKELFPSWT